MRGEMVDRLSKGIPKPFVAWRTGGRGGDEHRFCLRNRSSGEHGLHAHKWMGIGGGKLQELMNIRESNAPSAKDPRRHEGL